MSFFGELSRRNVIRVSIAYAIIAWLVVQVADIVLDTFGVPAWAMQMLMLLLVLGFVIAVIFAWAYEVTPEGVKRESEIDRSTSITHVTGRKLDRVIIGLLVVALGYFIWESRIVDRSETTTAAVPVAAQAPVEQEVLHTPAAEQSIAVLPFDNRSNQPEDEFFAEGMHDDLLSTLAQIGSMKVISRTSVMQYRNTTKRLPEIARELGVANILEGGVQRAGNQVRINVQLIDAATDEHLWAKIYDRELTAENLFAIQSEISKSIADALHATLSPEEEQRISTAPTDNLEAFDHYLRGRNLMATRAVEDLRRATQQFLKAVELDPQFALAWVGVADSHSLLENYGNLPRGTFSQIQDDAVNRALAIDPRIGEAYTSLGWLQTSKGDLGAAEQSYKQAIRLSPNYATSYHWLSNMLRDNLNRVEEALVYAQRAAELDPKSAVILANLWGTYSIIGDFESASRLADRALEIDPDFWQALATKADLLSLYGDYAGGIEAHRDVVEVNAGAAEILYFQGGRLLSIGAFEEAREISLTLGERFPDDPLTDLGEIYLALAEGRNPDARPVITTVLDENPALFVAMQAASAALYSDEFDLALQAFNYVLRDDLATMEYAPEFVGRWTDHLCTFAWVLRETQGTEARAGELVSRTISYFENELPDIVRHRERFGLDACYILADEPEKALDIMERQFENHFVFAWRWTLPRSLYDPLRDHPRFIELQSRFDARMAEQVSELRRSDRAKPAFEF